MPSEISSYCGFWKSQPTDYKTARVLYTNLLICPFYFFVIVIKVFIVTVYNIVSLHVFIPSILATSLLVIGETKLISFGISVNTAFRNSGLSTFRTLAVRPHDCRERTNYDNAAAAATATATG